MTFAQDLNAIGLILGMMGAAIVFFYGPPQPSFEQGVGMAVEDNTRLPDGKTAREHDAETRGLRRKYLILSKTGLGLIFAGFGLQLWAVLA